MVLGLGVTQLLIVTPFEKKSPFLISRALAVLLMKPLSIDIRRRIVRLSRDGYKQVHIAEIFGVSQGAVSKILRRHRETNDLTPIKPPGRPRLTTARNDRRLLHLSRTNRRMSSARLRHLWTRTIGIPLSRQTVNRRLLEHGYRARRPLKRIRLTRAHRVARHNWARGHANRPLGHWRHCMFTDESRFLLVRVDGRVRVRRLQGERLRDDCIQETVQGGGGSVMIWGGIHYGGRTPLVVPEGNVNAVVYRDILQNVCIPHARAVYGANFVLQDDNATPHRARIINTFLETEGVTRIGWPSRSPDMNPIEHIWDDMGRALRDRDVQPTNLDELTVALREEWDALPLEKINNLIDSMPRRIAALLRARGGHTRY